MNQMITKQTSGLIALIWFLSPPAPVPGQDYPLRDGQEVRVRAGLGNFFVKLRAGKAVRIAYLGGSITAQPGWRPKTLMWFQDKFPQADVSEINAAIGGTGSDLGVFRLEQDVLRYKPDLLFVEFAVNDGGATPHRIHQAMEKIIPRFDTYCTYHRLATLTVAENLPDEVHTMRLEVHPEQPDKMKIPAKRNQTIDYWVKL